MKTLHSHKDIDAILRNLMGDIEALIEAIAHDVPDCDLKLAELLEGEPESVRVAIIRKLREILKARAEEKEKELDKFLAAEQRLKIERQRSNFRQWLQWIMSEETIRKMREAFLASPMMERMVRGLGHDMAGKGMKDIQPGDRRDLGGLTTNAPHLQPEQGRERGDKRRQ